MKKTNLKISLLLAAICFIAGLFAVPYQIEMVKETMPDVYNEMMAELPLPIAGLQLLVSVQLFIVSFVLSFIGIVLAGKTGFSLHFLQSVFTKNSFQLNKRYIILAMISGVILSFVLMSYDRFYYQYQDPLIAELQPEFSLLALLAGITYGGVFEEIVMRLFFMSLIVWILMKIFKLTKETISGKYYWSAIILSSVLFAAAHFPATQMVFGELTSGLVIRGFILNGAGGLLYGYLYWRKGIEYSMLAHMVTHISMQLLVIPIFY
ncbi:CPBP family intramembrane metalloprotease [Bacillus lacus]|uniref:CPBP family intramembrane metalloprotease n=1 Tax=Metabacillus lacus TaxID=1983721 RepID=A0A7X2J2F9_9BACI|nr:CPBP family intramembrane glutamic endopeptidase [Metabacillus lacus]MRX74094.1 CPBP family intramembrane metalloprotease [Metabacillus lacus]